MALTPIWYAPLTPIWYGFLIPIWYGFLISIWHGFLAPIWYGNLRMPRYFTLGSALAPSAGMRQARPCGAQAYPTQQLSQEGARISCVSQCWVCLVDGKGGGYVAVHTFSWVGGSGSAAVGRRQWVGGSGSTAVR